MYLRAIEMKGFKSFPERTRLEFSPGVSVIVGPNGSGKSNITDAVLWALGEQSPVAVRGQSMQDVIFAGAHGVKSRSEAEVEVILDNASGRVDLPAGEIAITRRLNRAGFFGGSLAWITQLGQAPPSEHSSALRLRPAARCRWVRAGGGC